MALDNIKEFRLRIGQSKIPFGFENLQSSQNRIPLDRNDGLNSAVANERDIGIFFYWAPVNIRERFAYLVSSGLKGSGDYGIIGFGHYNGQTANAQELNNDLHMVGRVTYPFQLKNGQLIEASLQGYKGEFVINTSLQEINKFKERRVAASLIYYAQPIGFAGEFHLGRGPEFNPESMKVETSDLRGGYIQSMYYLKIKKDLFIPFFRWHFYEGGKKHEIDATRHRINEQEIGLEWQPHKNFELVLMYTFSNRVFENSLMPVNHQTGRLLRLQAQINF